MTSRLSLSAPLAADLAADPPFPSGEAAGGADLDAQFEAALAASGIPHEPLSVYDSNSWRRVGLRSRYWEVMAPCFQRDGHPNIDNVLVLYALVAAFNAMLATREHNHG